MVPDFVDSAGSARPLGGGEVEEGVPRILGSMVKGGGWVFEHLLHSGSYNCESSHVIMHPCIDAQTPTA